MRVDDDIPVFSNILNELHLNTLGEADDYKVVKSFQVSEHTALNGTRSAGWRLLTAVRST